MGELFDRAMTKQSLTDKDIKAMVRDFYTSMIERDDSVRHGRDEPIEASERQRKIDHYAELAANSRDALAQDAYEQVRQISMVMLARRFGIDATFEKVDRRKVQQALLRAGIEVADTLRARLEGNFSHEPADKLVMAALQGSGAGQAPIVPQRSEAVPPPRPVASDAPLFCAYAEEFRAAQTRRGRWEGQTSAQARKTFELFSEHCGDRPLSEYLKSDVHAFKEILEDLPADYGKAARYRGMPAADIVAMTKDADIPRLSPRTVQRHFHALSILWDEAIGKGIIADNIFHKWKFAATKRARDQRAMWESDDLRRLFATPVWTGCKSDARRSQPGPHVFRDEKFWLPLIAVFAGMRQEEICQLEPRDIRQAEGTWIIDINNRSGQQLKNANAVRLVPIHSMLIKLGLLAYAERQRTEGAQLLFPKLTPGGADGRLGHYYSKWFTRYRRDVNLYAPGQDFHSFRHSATTFLFRGGVTAEIIDRLTGHETTGETARYNKGFTIANLKDAIELLDIGVDLSGLMDASFTPASADLILLVK